MGHGNLGAAMGPQSVDGPIAVEAQGQVTVKHRFAVAVVHQEEGRPVSSGADQNQRVSLCRSHDLSRQLFDGRGFDQ